jgi:hypothetical protein
VALVGVGIWMLRTARNLHLHDPGEHRAHGHAVASLGVMHGLAGTTAVVALLPVRLLPEPALGRMAGWAGAGSIAVGLWWLGSVLLAG